MKRLPVALAVVALFALVIPTISACRVSQPFRGAGFDPHRGVVHPLAGSQVVVVVTSADIVPGRGGDFAAHLRSVLSAMDRQDGLVGYAVRRELFGSRVWTLSAWVDRASMLAFVRSPEHRTAMAQGGVLPASFTSVVASVDASAVPPSWAEAERLLSTAAADAPNGAPSP